MKNKDGIDKKDPWWRPAVHFYAKTTGWIILPVLLALFVKNKFKDTFASNSAFLLLMLLAFGMTCYGIYREIKAYKRALEIEEKDPPSPS